MDNNKQMLNGLMSCKAPILEVVPTAPCEGVKKLQVGAV